MTCDYLKMDGKIVGIVCSRGKRRQRCAWCTHTVGEFQCDWKMGEGKTCDKHLCAAHAQEVGENKHLCPEHQKAYKLWQERKASG